MRVDLIGGAIQRVQPRPIAFFSPLQAQFWLEWRRNGRVALAVWVVLVWVVLGLDIVFRFYQNQWSRNDVLLPLGVAAAVWVGITGLNIARDGASKKLALSPFSAVRPVKTGMLLLAKLMAGAVLWVAAAAILAASYFLCEAATGGLEDLADFSGMAIIALAISLHVLVGILPLCVSGRLPGFPWSLLPLLVAYGGILNALVWFVAHPQYEEILFGALVGLLILKMGVAFWAFRRAITQKLSSPRFVFCYGVVWIVAAGFLTSRAFDAIDRGPLLLVPAAALALPLARIGLAQLALEVNRHR
jgi:hypothetical protein